MAETKPTTAPPSLPAPSRATPASTQGRLDDLKRQLPRDRTT